MLEPALELAVARHVGRVVEVGQQLDLAGDLAVGVDEDDPRQHVLAFQHAAARGHKRPIEAQVAARGEPVHHGIDRGLAGMEVDGRAREREVFTCSGARAA